jgi:SAM-dependent methyltransferase
VDSFFNRSKSDIAFQEFTLAGAAVMATDLPEFSKNAGCTVFTGDEGFERSLEILINNSPLRFALNHESLYHLPLLSDTNQLRKDVIEKLLIFKKKYHPGKVELPTFTDKQFHDYELSHGMTPDLEQYQQMNEKTAKWIIETMNPRFVLELGCGVGGTLLELLRRGVTAYGLELNPNSVQYFKEHYPVFGNQIIQADITTEPMITDGVGDLVYSIECFEHITMPEDWWNKFLSDLASKFKFFYFTSTPFYSVESFDIAWGHNNIRLMSRWKKLFEANGWQLISNPKITVPWDLYFKSVIIEPSTQ